MRVDLSVAKDVTPSCLKPAPQSKTFRTQRQL